MSRRHLVDPQLFMLEYVDNKQLKEVFPGNFVNP